MGKVTGQHLASQHEAGGRGDEDRITPPSGEDHCFVVGADGSSVQVCDPCSHRDWDQQWKAFAGWSAFHGSGWAEVLRNTYNLSPCYLSLRTPDGQHSMLPLMEARSVLFGRRGVSLPFTDTCPSLCADPVHSDLLLKGALLLARRRGWRYLELRGGGLAKQHGRASIHYHEHILDLRKDEATIFSRFRPELRTAIRKAQKSGLQVEIGIGSDLVEKFYQLHSRTRQRQGVPMQPFTFFENIQRYILARQAGLIVLASRGERPVAAAIFLHSETSAIFKFAASDPDLLRLRPNNLVMWEAIKWYLQRGVTSLHLGRTSASNEGLRRFKLTWGAAEQPLYYYKVSATKEMTMPSVDRSSGWANHVFRHLPIPVLRSIGCFFYQHID